MSDKSVSTHAAAAFSRSIDRLLGIRNSRRFALSRTAARRLWAAISMLVLNAVSKPSLITPAATGIAQSARRKRVNAGSQPASAKCCRLNMIGRYRSPNNPYFPCVTNLPNQIARTLRHLAAQNLVTIFGDPHQVILDIAHRVPALSILGHSLILVENRSKLTA